IPAVPTFAGRRDGFRVWAPGFRHYLLTRLKGHEPGAPEARSLEPGAWSQSDTANSPGTIGRVRGSLPTRARLPTYPTMARKTTSFAASPSRVCGKVRHISQRMG